MSHHSETQALRLGAIDAEMIAVASQSKALHLISIEHHCGLDVGCNVSVAHFASQTQDLVDSLKAVLPRLSKMNDLERADAVGAFKKNAQDLRQEIQLLIPQRDAEASRHLEDSLAEPRPKKVPDAAIVPDFAAPLKREAHVHCHAAETTEIRNFVNQVHAVIELCLETLCVGAESAEE
jgi:hypothetical protein